MYWFLSVLTALLAYFCGSLNSVVIASNFVFHSNLRRLGKGSAFVSNFHRVHGWLGWLKLGLVELLLDLLPILLAGLLFGLKGHALVGRALAGFCLVMGRLWPAANELKGTSATVALILAAFGVDVSVGVAVLLVTVGTCALSRYLSFGTLVGAAIFVIVVLLMLDDALATRLCVFTALAIFVRHIPAISRLVNGKEPRLSFEKDITYKLDEKF